MKTTSARGRWATAAVVVGIGLVAAGCGGASSSSGATGDTSGQGVVAANPVVTKAPSAEPQKGGRLVFGIEAESDGFDPTKGRWALSGMQVAYTVYDPLMAFDADGVARPYALESATPSADYKVWMAKLRPGLVFHNGTKATSTTLQKQIQAFHDSTLTGPAVRPYKSSKVIDELTLEVTLSSPWAAFPNVLTGQGGPLVAPEVFDNPDGNRNPIGTGPFVFKEWKTDDHLSVVRNDKYWMTDAGGQSLPYLSEVVFKPIADASSREKALESGDINILQDNHPQELQLLKDKAQEGRLQYVPDQGEKEETFIMFNVQKAPLDDPLLRQALAYATNVDDYIDVTGDEKDQAADGPFEKSSKWYVDAGFPKHDLAKAQELIAQYKAKHGDGPVTFKLATTSTPENAKIIQLMQQQWQAIGVDVQADTVEQIQLIAQAVSGTYDAVLWRGFGSPDPDADYHFWAPINTAPPGQFGLNFARLTDDQVQKDLDIGRESADPAARLAAYQDAQKRWAELVPYIWLDHVQWVIAADNSVRGIGNNPWPGVTKPMPFQTGAFRLTTTWIDPSSK